MRGFFQVVGFLAVLATGAPSLVAAAQSVVERPPNLSGGWVGTAGTLQFNFLHRFSGSAPPERKVSNVPTFLVAAGLPGRSLVGANYATNSDVAPRYPNEWELFARHLPLSQEAGAPLDAGVQAGYNLAAASVDGELSLGRWLGPVRVMAAGRAMSNGYHAGEARFAVAGGALLRVTRAVTLAADAASLLAGPEGERAAWSAGVQLAIPYTPHSLSLQASNTGTATLQGASRGTDRVLYGFEFTVPLTLSRYVGRSPAPPPPVMDTVPRIPASDTTPWVPVTDTLSAAPPADTVRPRPAADTVAPPRSRLPADTAAPALPAPRQPAPPPAVVEAKIRGFRYLPARLEVRAGTTVVWTNEDQVPHTVTADRGSFDSGLIAAGASWRRTFREPGTYSFHCSPHPFMTGVIVVR